MCFITAMAVKIGQFIQAVRKKAQLTQKVLSDLAGIGKTTLFDIENGKESVRLSNILKVRRVLNIRLKARDPLGNETEVDHA